MNARHINNSIEMAFNKVKFGFSPISSTGVASKATDYLSNENIKSYSNERFAFYTQLYESVTGSKPWVVDKIMNTIGMFSERYYNLQKQTKKITDTPYPNREHANDLQKTLKTALDTSLSDVKVSKTGGAPSLMEIIKEYSEPAQQKQQGVDAQKTAADIFNDMDDTRKAAFVRKLETDPLFNGQYEKIDFADRGIFIAMTFIIRAIALFLTEWGVYSGYITSFIHTFWMYFGMYICLFLLICFLTNARKDDKTFKMLFYYMDADAEEGKGLHRIIVHILCILFLIPIPYIVKEYRGVSENTQSILTFSEKSALLSAVDTFSLYMWVLTSIVALKM